MGCKKNWRDSHPEDETDLDNKDMLDLFKLLLIELRIMNTYSAMGFDEELTKIDLENKNAN